MLNGNSLLLNYNPILLDDNPSPNINSGTIIIPESYNPLNYFLPPDKINSSTTR